MSKLVTITSLDNDKLSIRNMMMLGRSAPVAVATIANQQRNENENSVFMMIFSKNGMYGGSCPYELDQLGASEI